MQSLIRQLVTKNGRNARILAGAVLILIGLFFPNDKVGLALVIIGWVPILAGILDVCLIAPLFGLPLKGKDIRKQIDQ